MFPPGDLRKPPKLPKEFVFGGVVEENGEPEPVPEPKMVAVKGAVLLKTVLLGVDVAVAAPKVKAAGDGDGDDDDDDDVFLGGKLNGEVDVDVPKGEEVVEKLKGFVLAAWEGGGAAKEKPVVGRGAVLGVGALKENPEDDTGNGAACGVKPPLLPSGAVNVEEVGALNPVNFEGRAGEPKENPEDNAGNCVPCGVNPPLPPLDVPDVEEEGALNPANFEGGAGIERIAGGAELSCDSSLGRSSKSFRILNRIAL